MENLQMKSKVSEMELEYKSTKIIKSEEQKKKKKIEQSLKQW